VRLPFGLWLLLQVAGCGSTPAGTTDPDGGPTAVPGLPREPAESPRVELPRRVYRPARAGEEVAIPAGPVRLGSRPGVTGRRPDVEADLVVTDVPAFRIDRLPYPNDPSAAPRTRVARAEAQALCDADGKRLCTEIEWERACKGETVGEWPGDDGFDVETCSISPGSCESPLGVLALGTAAFEWTASDVTRGLGSDEFSAVTRGASPLDPADAHRCGARHAHAPTASESRLGFRCCRGPAPALEYPTEAAYRRFRALEVDEQELRRILLTVPELRRFAADFRSVTSTGVDQALGRGGYTRETIPWSFLESVLVWSPAVGEQVWVVAGTGGGAGIIAALYPMPDGTFEHAGSFIFADEPVSVAVAWDVGSPRELLWSTCWACGGESGAVVYREDNTIAVVQR